jgi:hypothetical protein
VSLLRDIANIWRAIPGRGSSNWRGYHAGSALFFGAVFAFTSVWWSLSGKLLEGACLGVLAVLAFVYWRCLIPKALWYSKVERILRGD